MLFFVSSVIVSSETITFVTVLKEVYQPDKFLGYLLAHSMKAVSGLLVQKFQDAGYDIDRPQWVIMAKSYHLEKGSLLQSEVCELFMGNKTGVTRAVDSLVKRGWLSQQIHETDRRNRVLDLTDKGRAVVPNLMKMAFSCIEEVTQGIEQTEVEICKKVLTQIIANVKGDLSTKDKEE